MTQIGLQFFVALNYKFFALNETLGQLESGALSSLESNTPNFMPFRHLL